jgi:hypothetical protein
MPNRLVGPATGGVQLTARMPVIAGTPPTTRSSSTPTPGSSSPSAGPCQATATVARHASYPARIRPGAVRTLEVIGFDGADVLVELADAEGGETGIGRIPRQEVHPRLTRRAAWLDHEGSLPIIEGSVIRLQVEKLPSGGVNKPVRLRRSGTGATGTDVDRCWHWHQTQTSQLTSTRNSHRPAGSVVSHHQLAKHMKSDLRCEPWGAFCLDLLHMDIGRVVFRRLVQEQITRVDAYRHVGTSLPANIKTDLRLPPASL